MQQLLNLKEQVNGLEEVGLIPPHNNCKHHRFSSC
jgi:hypothetical protein